MRSLMLSFLIVPALAVGACTDSTPGSTAASPRDVTCEDPVYYRVDSVQVPEQPGDGGKYGVDLDGDGAVDNAIGTLLGSIVSTNPDIGAMSPKVDHRLGGDVTWLVAVANCDDGTQHVSLGDSGGGDTAPLSILVDPLGDYAPVAWVRADGLVAHVAIADQTVDGVVGFALPMPGAARALAAPMARYLTQELAAGTSPIAKQLDADHDGVVTPDELIDSHLGQTLLMPDLDHGTALSVGLHVHATRVAL
jgi:hypothetical protein